MKICLKILIICLVLPYILCKPNKHADNVFEKEFKKKQQLCEKTLCSFLPANFNENCVNQCVSNRCYKRVFIDIGLEPGEIDQTKYFFKVY